MQMIDRQRKWIAQWGGMAALVIVTLALAACALPGVSEPVESAWTAQEPPLKTQWFDTVSPENALPEYPRPQLVRAEWLNLNGEWEWEKARVDDAPPFGKTLGRRILVPFAVESALSGIMEQHVHSMWYRRTFTVPEAWAGERVLLHFGAVDWQSTIWVNGVLLGEHKGGYDAFTFDITDALIEGDNEVIVGVFDPSDGGMQPVGKQRLEPGGIWYTGVSGIWQTVWLEPVPAQSIGNMRLTPHLAEDFASGRLEIAPQISGDFTGLTLEAVAFAEGTEVASVESAVGDLGERGAIALEIAEPRLWAFDDPFLYDLTLTLKQGDTVIDEVSSYFGMRSVALKRIGPATRIVLNGEFVFQLGLLDQGFWPDGLYTAPTDEALKFDIETAKRLGYNLLRKHVKVEPARWYYWADKLGMLVWQDMPNMPEYKELDETAHTQFHAELQALVEQHYNSPSIIMWVVFNEGWGQFDTRQVVDFVRALDSSRLINNASGWTDASVGDVIDKHEYVGPAIPTPSSGRASVLGEFGGLGLPIEGHKWDPNRTYDYEMQADIAGLQARYLGLIEQLHPLMDMGRLSAAVYTQLTDVEIEVNGILTYDRAVEKMDGEVISAAHRALIEASREIQ